MNLKNDSDADVRAFYGGSAKQYGGQSVAGNTNLDEDDVYAFRDEDKGAGEAAEAEAEEERVVPDKWEEEAEEEEKEDNKTGDEEEKKGGDKDDKTDARPDEE